MTFISPLFFLFISLVISINYFLPHRFRYVFILISSILFVGFYNIESLAAVILFSFFNYVLAKYIRNNKWLYLLGIIVNSAAIVMFNYFSTSSNGLIFSFTLINFQIDKFILALGLSFYSLQNIAYITEVYYNRLQPESTICKYFLYNMFFPKFISGPIILPGEFIPQIENNIITNDKLIRGFQLLLLGIFKKMVIADRIAPGVSSVFDYHSNYSGLTVLTASYLFTIQLYFDFSGYTNMALGISEMLGYNLKDNFNFPLRSSSVSEFWRRWHISLISWFTNYIYYPVVFRLRYYKKGAPLVGIFLTFFISMIWHGIGLTFLAWAVCHTVYLGFESLTRKSRAVLSDRFNNPFYKIVCVFIVFNLVCFSNVFFRSDSFETAIHLIKNIFSGFIPDSFLTGLINPIAVGGHQTDEFNIFITILLLSVFLIFERRIYKAALSEKINLKYIVLCVLLIMIFGVFNSGTRFIYMQF